VKRFVAKSPGVSIQEVRLAEAAGRILERLAVPEKAGTVEDSDLDLLTEEL